MDGSDDVSRRGKGVNPRVKAPGRHGQGQAGGVRIMNISMGPPGLTHARVARGIFALRKEIGPETIFTRF